MRLKKGMNAINMPEPIGQLINITIDNGTGIIFDRIADKDYDITVIFHPPTKAV